MRSRFFPLPTLALVATLLTLLVPLTAQAQSDEAEVLEMSLGNPDAPVTMIEYASLTCVHCRRFHASVYPALKKDYIDTGKVRLVFREVYFDRLGLWGAMIARCGGSEKYFGIVDLLFRRFDDWVTAGDAGSSAKVLQQIGRVAGLGDEQIAACLKDEAKATALVAKYQEHRGEHNITGTPSFFINGDSQANVSYPELVEVLDEAIADAQ